MVFILQATGVIFGAVSTACVWELMTWLRHDRNFYQGEAWISESTGDDFGDQRDRRYPE